MVGGGATSCFHGLTSSPYVAEGMHDRDVARTTQRECGRQCRCLSRGQPTTWQLTSPDRLESGEQKEDATQYVASLSAGTMADRPRQNTIRLPLVERPERVRVLRNLAPGELLVHEIYRSIQGESTFAGLPCTFVRLTACHLRCRWCDTPHAFGEGRVWPVDAVVEEVQRLGERLVEVTGGEPLLQPDVVGLMERLLERGHTVLLETSGSLDIGPVPRDVHIIMDLKCPGSGEVDANRWENIELLKDWYDEVKFVVASKEDFDWAVDVVRRFGLHERLPVLISPAYGLVQPADLAAWILDTHLPLRLQLQLHKYIWGPHERGV